MTPELVILMAFLVVVSFSIKSTVKFFAAELNDYKQNINNEFQRLSDEINELEISHKNVLEDSKTIDATIHDIKMKYEKEIKLLEKKFRKDSEITEIYYEQKRDELIKFHEYKAQKLINDIAYKITKNNYLNKSQK